MKNIIYTLILIFCFSHLTHAYENCSWKDYTLTSSLIEATQATISLCSGPNPHPECRTEITDKVFQEEDFSFLSFFSKINKMLQYARFSFFHTNKKMQVIRANSRNEKPISQLCFLASSSRGKSIFDSKESEHSCSDERTSLKQNFYYCENSTERSCQTTMSVIDDKGNKRSIYPRAPCLSQNYIQTLADSFNKMSQCFGFSKEEQKNMFSIINHESFFMPNSRSNTGARCAGQLTTRSLVDLNVNIILKQNPVYLIYQEALERCPFLETVLIPSNLTTSDIYQNVSYDNLVKKLYQSPITCSLISDMSRCFFYSFLFQAASFRWFDQHIESIQYAMHPEDLVKFKTLVSYLSYNGGQSIAKRELKKFAHQFLINLKNPEIQEEFYNNNDFLDLSKLQTSFISHLKKVKRKNGLNVYSNQTFKYPSSVAEDNAYFQKTELVSSHLLKLNTNSLLTFEEIEDTIFNIHDQCQF